MGKLVRNSDEELEEMLEKSLEESTLFVSKESVKDYSTLDTDVIFASPCPTFEVEQGNRDNEKASATCEKERTLRFRHSNGIYFLSSH